MVRHLYCFQFFTVTKNTVMSILEATSVHSNFQPKKNLNVVIALPCRGTSPSTVSSALKIWEPLPTEALPTRPAAPEPPISTAVPGIQWQFSKPGLQARLPPHLAAPAPNSRPQPLPAGRRVKASTAPPPSQVSAFGLGRKRVGWGAGELSCLRVLCSGTKAQRGLTQT